MFDIGLLKSIIGRALEFLIGRNPFSGDVSPAQKAAYDIFIELEGSPAVKLRPDDGRSIRAILTALGNDADEVAEILRKYGVLAAKNNKDGNLTATTVALRIQNTIVDRINRWETEVAGLESEQDWERRDECLRDLKWMRVEVGAYLDTLAGIARTPDLSDRIPRPSSAAATATVFDAPVGIASGETPKKSMVRWLDPIECVRIGVSTRRAKEKRTRQQAGLPYEKIVLAHADSTTDASSADNANNAESDTDELWIDYVSDLGDAFDSTMAVAWHLGAPFIELPTDRAGELPDAPRRLPRGTVMVMGGDEVYPYATAKGYANQLTLPYRLAGDPANRPDRTHADRPQPARQVFAIPGNHDWLGGINHFEDVFVVPDKFATHWDAPQTQRWWAIALRAGWWMWGIDTGLDDTLDEAQLSYFAQAANELAEGDRVIVCSPVPMWQLRQKRKAKYESLHRHLTRLITEQKASVPLFLAGDSHFFAQYRRVDGEADEQHITAGGGGAFLQPTHNLVEQIPSTNEPVFKLGARWPRPIDSRELAANLAVLRDRQFRLLFVVLGLFHTAFAALVATGSDAGPRDGNPISRLVSAAEHVASVWQGWPLLLLFIAIGTGATVPNSKERDNVAGARKFGFVHGVAQACGLVAVATVALLVGPNAWWWRLVLVPLVGGVLSTLLLVGFTRWINQEIKANDTVAYSSAHLTRYKNFIRMSINARGDLKLYVIGLDPVGTGWADALTKDKQVPPKDAGAMVHYVWGWQWVAGSADQLFDREETLGRDHPQTIESRRDRVVALLSQQRVSEAAILAADNAAICAKKYGDDDPSTCDHRELLGEATRRSGDLDAAVKLLDHVAQVRQHQLASSDDPSPEAQRALARARCRLVAALVDSEADGADSTRLGRWVRSQTDDRSGDWRNDLLGILEHDDQTFAVDDESNRRMCSILIEHYRIQLDQQRGLNVLHQQLDRCTSSCGYDHEVTRLARRLLALQYLASDQRVEGTELLEQNGNDRLSLLRRRRLATALLEKDPKTTESELRALVAEGREYASTDKALVDNFLIPVWIQLASSLEPADTERTAEMAELRACYDATQSESARGQLNDLRTRAGLDPEPGGVPASATTTQILREKEVHYIPERGQSIESKSGSASALALAGAGVVIAAAIIGGVVLLDLRTGPAKQPDEVAHSAVTPTAIPSPATATSPIGAASSLDNAGAIESDGIAENGDDQNGLGLSDTEPAINRLPPSLGRNIVVLPLDADAERGDEAKVFSNVLADQLAAGAGLWKIWGPDQLGRDGIAVDELTTLLAFDSSDSDYNDRDAALAERNIDVVIFGTLTGTGANSIITLDAWFRGSTNGIAEAGIAGRVTIWSNSPGGSTKDIDRIAADLPQGEARLVPLLQGFSEFHNAEVTEDFRRAKALFVQTRDGTSDQNRAGFGLFDLATLFVATSENFIATTIAGSNPARYDTLGEARETFEIAAGSANIEVRTRALMGVTQTLLSASSCVGGRFPTLNDAEIAFADAQAASTSIAPGPHEIVFRLDALESNIAYCRWRDGGSQTTVLVVVNRLIDNYSRRPPEEKERIVFAIAETYGQRAIIHLGATSLDDLEQKLDAGALDKALVASAAQDFATADCLARAFRRGVWKAWLAQLGYTADCEASELGAPTPIAPA